MVVEVEYFAFEVCGDGRCACGRRRCGGGGGSGGEDGVRVGVGGYVIRLHGGRERHGVPVDVVYGDLDGPLVLVGEGFGSVVVGGAARRRGVAGGPYPGADGRGQRSVAGRGYGGGMLAAREEGAGDEP